jgi:DNA-binding IclR family transcriptional regulator
MHLALESAYRFSSFAERSSILSTRVPPANAPTAAPSGWTSLVTPSPAPGENGSRKPKEDRHFVTALARGLEVLSCFRHGETTLSNQELAQRCQLPKSTVSRLTMTLTKLGYLIHVQESGRYRLGTACLALGSALLTKLDVRKIARPMMQDLANFSGGSVSLGVRDKLSMIYLENCRSSAALTLTLDVGSRMPLSTSSIGRAWLAAVAEPLREEVMAQIRELDHLAWPAVKEGIDQAREDYASLGLTCSFGDWHKEVNGVARAFDPGNGLPLMAVNVGGPSYNMSPEFLLEQVRPRLIEVVKAIEDALPG